MRTHRRTRRCPQTRSVARHFTDLDDWNADREPVLASSDCTVPPWLNRRDSLPCGRTSDRAGDPVGRQQDLVPGRVVHPLTAQLQRRSPCLGRRQRPPSPVIQVPQHRPRVVLVEPNRMSHHHHDDTIHNQTHPTTHPAATRRNPRSRTEPGSHVASLIAAAHTRFTQQARRRGDAAESGVRTSTDPPPNASDAHARTTRSPNSTPRPRTVPLATHQPTVDESGGSPHGSPPSSPDHRTGQQLRVRSAPRAARPSTCGAGGGPDPTHDQRAATQDDDESSADRAAGPRQSPMPVRQPSHPYSPTAPGNGRGPTATGQPPALRSPRNPRRPPARATQPAHPTADQADGRTRLDQRAELRPLAVRSLSNSMGPHHRSSIRDLVPKQRRRSCPRRWTTQHIASHIATLISRLGVGLGNRGAHGLPSRETAYAPICPHSRRTAPCCSASPFCAFSSPAAHC